MAQEWFIGLMSGTSLDGIDGVLCRFDADGLWGGVAAHAHHPFEAGLRDALAGLQAAGPDELHRAALAANRLALAYADVCAELLQTAELPAAAVRAIGAHGQTVRHRPGCDDGVGYTVQINQPALLAERIGIDVVADFRSRDVAARGQGAPLVPPFHAAVFRHPDIARAVVNIGGISNATLLADSSMVVGFDCGPGNALLDHWCHRHTGQPFDEAGGWARTGEVLPRLLETFLHEPFFDRPPPKSTGRDLFNPDWLDRQLATAPGVRPQDVQATLAELTATVIAESVLRHGRHTQELLVCGGGAYNLDLMARLAARLPGITVTSTGAVGLPPLHVEAAAFAWLARQHCHRSTGNLPAVTGARGARILGALYPA